eukprot:scaffold17458_cov62-Cyclotella_meneghiniana.AAC.1
MPGVMNRYIRFENAGDEYVGRSRMPLEARLNDNAILLGLKPTSYASSHSIGLLLRDYPTLRQSGEFEDGNGGVEDDHDLRSQPSNKRANEENAFGGIIEANYDVFDVEEEVVVTVDEQAIAQQNLIRQRTKEQIQNAKEDH